MARRATKNRSGRVASAQRYSRQAVPRSLTFRLSPSTLRLIEDRRTWSPMGPLFRPAAALNRAATRIVAKQNPFQPQLSQTKALLAFADPNKVAICARRGIRRAVLHALGVAGARGLRRPRRNAYSSISCR